jgi:hypothetical protein
MRAPVGNRLLGVLLLLHGVGWRGMRHRILRPCGRLGVQHHLRVTRVGGRAYWALGWLLTLGAVYVVAQYARSRGAAAPAVPGVVALVCGAVLCATGLQIARRFGHRWAGVLLGGLGILGIGVGLANLLR